MPGPHKQTSAFEVETTSSKEFICSEWFYHLCPLPQILPAVFEKRNYAYLIFTNLHF